MKYLLISFIIFTLYVGLVTLKFGVLKSVSDSYYSIKRKYLFTLALWGFALPAIIAANLNGVTLPGVLMFLAGSGICFVGAAPEFRLKLDGDVHVIAAVSGVVLGMASIWLFGYWYISVLFAVASLVIRFTLKNYTWYIEVLAFYLIMLGLLLNLIKL